MIIEAMRNAVEAMDKHDYEMADHILCQAIAEAEKQESVAVMQLHTDGWDLVEGIDTDWLETLPFGTTLYTHPQPKREWVELTPEEEDALVEQAREVPAEVPCPDYNKRLLTLANSKLKDKNT